MTNEEDEALGHPGVDAFRATDSFLSFRATDSNVAGVEVPPYNSFCMYEVKGSKYKFLTSGRRQTLLPSRWTNLR
jgi:hypothetical protein